VAAVGETVASGIGLVGSTGSAFIVWMVAWRLRLKDESVAGAALADDAQEQRGRRKASDSVVHHGVLFIKPPTGETALF
jgi:hypothetical protein